MLKYLISFCLFFCVSTAFAQEDSVKAEWKAKGIAGFNISQIAFSDWSQGGDNSITYSLIGNFNLNYVSSEWTFKNGLKIAYGQTKIAEENFKTNDNELYLENVLTKIIDWKVSPYFSNTVRTGLAPGYKYEDDGAKQVSLFFDPGYISQSIGLNYDKNETFQSRLGFAVQETFADKFPRYTDDPETEDIETFKFESGIESVTDLEYDFMENMLYKSKLRLFTRFEALDVWDVRWDNTVSAKINDYFVVNLNVLVVYMKNESLRTQIKEALQLGINIILFEN